MSTQSTKDDIAVATAALLGGHPTYYDYGHPERATARQYWTIDLWTPENPIQSFRAGTVHGFTRADCARKWLRAMGVDCE